MKPCMICPCTGRLRAPDQSYSSISYGCQRRLFPVLSIMPDYQKRLASFAARRQATKT
jgi:hypothetical protein